MRGRSAPLNALSQMLILWTFLFPSSCYASCRYLAHPRHDSAVYAHEMQPHLQSASSLRGEKYFLEGKTRIARIVPPALCGAREARLLVTYLSALHFSMHALSSEKPVKGTWLCSSGFHLSQSRTWLSISKEAVRASSAQEKTACSALILLGVASGLKRDLEQEQNIL